MVSVYESASPSAPVTIVTVMNRDAILIWLILVTLQSRKIVCDDAPPIEIGSGVNIFRFFGDFSMSVRMTPRNDTQPWLFRHLNPSVFDYPDEDDERNRQKAPLEGKYEMILCENLDKLYEAYFSDVSVEGIEQSWKIFSRGWSTSLAAKKLGLPEGLLRNENADLSFVLVRLQKVAERITSRKGMGLSLYVQERLEYLATDNETNVDKFLNEVGTHYIHSYATGNSLFQVLVFKESIFKQIKWKIEEWGLNSSWSDEWMNLFSPLWAEELGSIMISSGNLNVTAWARDVFVADVNIIRYPSLLLLHKRPDLLPVLGSRLGNEAVLKLKMKLLDGVLEDSNERDRLRQIVNNRILLFEENI